jgi:hypothetical protein
MPVAARSVRCRGRDHPRHRHRCRHGGQDAAIRSELPTFPEGQSELRELQTVPGTECLQERRGRHQPERLVHHLGEGLRPLSPASEGRVTSVDLAFDTAPAMGLTFSSRLTRSTTL